MIRKVLAGAALCVVSTAASAADLPGRASASAPAPVFVAASSWAGFYAGAIAGYAQLTSRVDDNYGASALDEFNGDWFSHKPKGFVGGLVAGYNWQSGRLVYGVEADVSGSTASKLSFEGDSYDGLNTKLGAISTIRGRLGYAVTDSLMAYGTIGAAAGYFSHMGGDRGSESGWEDDDSVLSLGKWKLGWTVGAGAEMKLSGNWSARVEYMYADFGSNKGYANDDGENARFQDKAHVARVGLTYRFGGSSAPVIARY